MLSFGVGLLALVVGLIALAVAWASYQADRRDHADSVRLTDLADDLALKVRAQWEGEGKVRRLYEPGSLTVSWKQAPEGLTEQWSKIREAAERWPRAGSVDTSAWATSPADLAGEGSEIKDVFSRRVPTDRLVILGQEGAGKTVLLVQLLLDLLVERPAGEGARVPVLFSLASWNPVEESDLFAWMDRRLAIDYEFMGLPAPAPDSSVSRGRALLDRRLILPLLDGFDEIPHGFRMQALMKINEAMVEGQGIVLSCRTQDYRNALSQEPGALGALPVPLERAAGIELQNLDAGIVERFLREGTDEEGFLTGRWRPVTDLLADTAQPIAQALSTPLMASLAKTIYNPRPGDPLSGLPDPAELLADSVAGRPRTRAEIEDHLLAGFLPAAYRRHRGHPCRWTSNDAQAALQFLACHLKDNLNHTTDVEWWKLHRATPRVVSALVVGLPVWITVVVLISWMAASPLPWWGAVATGTIIGSYALVLFCTVLVPRSEPAARIHVPWLSAAGLVAGCCFVGYLEDWGTAFLSLPLVAVVVFLVFGWRATRSADIVTAMDPVSILERDRSTARKIIIGSALVCVVTTIGLATVGLVRTGWDALEGTAWVLLGFPLFGLYVGIAIAFRQTASPALAVACWYFAVRGRAPRDLMGFLADAHERHSVLRRVGAVYQFRHLDLQQHLANRQ
ncbi:NACHT domain-containing protein [Streptomyces sp. OZ13]|uniref:NACHT domain-containing protein n=1 Tax=Streptomyces sp. OZ13 TaxID=3452210 RepID=UPI003F8B21D5